MSKRREPPAGKRSNVMPASTVEARVPRAGDGGIVPPQSDAASHCSSPKLHRYLAGAVIALATLAAYHNSFSVPFLFDDNPSISGNPTIRQLWPVQRVLLPPGGATTVSSRPLVNLSFALNYAIGGTRVWGYHVLNLAVHILAGLTLFGIVRRTLLQPALRRRFGTAALPLALAVALLWAVHPLQTESVTYIAQRAESLMGLFYLLTLYCFIRGTEAREALLDPRARPGSAGVPPAGSPGRHDRDCRRDAGAPAAAGWFALAIAACLLGMATKEVMVTAPLLVLLYDRTFMAGTFPGALRQRWRLYAGLSAGWLLLAFEWGGQKAALNAAVSRGSYALTQSWAISHYLWLSVWPHPLVFDYGTLLLTRFAQVAPGALMVALLAGAVAVSLRRWPALGFPGCWFFAILAPTSSVMPLAGQTVAEHRMYLPLAAVVTLAVLGIYRLAGRRSLVLFPMLAVALVFLTARRNADYRSDLVLWGDTAAKRPDNARALNNLGNALLANGRTDDAIAQFQKALQVQPGYADGRGNLGSALLQAGRTQDAIAQFQMALSSQPNDAGIQNNLGLALLWSGHVDEAIVHFQTALELQPRLAGAHRNLGNALLQKGRLDEAIAQLRRTLELQPGLAQAHNDLGNALLQSGRLDEAIAQFRIALNPRPDEAAAPDAAGDVLARGAQKDETLTHYRRTLEIPPALAEFHDNLGNALLQKGQLDEAIVQFKSALELQPDSAAAHYALGNALLRLGQLDDAIAQYRKALELQPTLAEAHNNLGTALLQKGRLAEALAHWQQALELEPGNVLIQNNLAWVLATSPEAAIRNGARAVELAQRANQLSGGENPMLLGTLAAAYAEAGRMADAVATAQRALQLARAQTNTPLAAALQVQLGLHQAGLPFRAAGQTNAPATPVRP